MSKSRRRRLERTQDVPSFSNGAMKALQRALPSADFIASSSMTFSRSSSPVISGKCSSKAWRISESHLDEREVSWARCWAAGRHALGQAVESGGLDLGDEVPVRLGLLHAGDRERLLNLREFQDSGSVPWCVLVLWRNSNAPTRRWGR